MCKARRTIKGKFKIKCIKWQKWTKRRRWFGWIKRGTKHKNMHHECYHNHLSPSHLCKFDLWAFFLHPHPLLHVLRQMSLDPLELYRQEPDLKDEWDSVGASCPLCQVGTVPMMLVSRVQQAGVQGDEDAEAWNLTNAMAASSLQNSSRTMTPSSNVTWSILNGEKTPKTQCKKQHTFNHVCARNAWHGAAWYSEN